MRSGIIVIDFEATSLPDPGSWPIEVALGWPDSDQVKSWLIKPDPAWLDEWTWDFASSRVHCIPRELLDEQGTPARDVAIEVATALAAASLVLSDVPDLEEFWLRALLSTLSAADRPEITISSLLAYAGEAMNLPPLVAWDELAPMREQISLTKPRTHRAGADVAHYVELIRRLDGQN
jgi:hypothetical protein